MVWLNNSQDSRGTPCDARTGIVRAPHGNFQCFSYPTGPVRGPCVTRKGVVRRPYGHTRELAQPALAKIPHGRRIWPYGARTHPLRSPHGLFTGCLRYLNSYGARKLIMHALHDRAPSHQWSLQMLNKTSDRRHIPPPDHNIELMNKTFETKLLILKLYFIICEIIIAFRYLFYAPLYLTLIIRLDLLISCNWLAKYISRLLKWEYGINTKELIGPIKCRAA